MKPLQGLAPDSENEGESATCPSIPCEDAHEEKLLLVPALPQFPKHNRCPFLAGHTILTDLLCECAKLREMRFTGLAEAGAAQQRESKLSPGEGDKEPGGLERAEGREPGSLEAT